MFTVSEAESAAIRAVYEREGESTAGIELRVLFPGIADNPATQAKEMARMIAEWRQQPAPSLTDG